MNILTHFLEFNTCMMPDFLYFIKYKNTRNIKLNFEKDNVKFTKYEKKNKRKRGKDKIVYTV